MTQPALDLFDPALPAVKATIGMRSIADGPGSIVGASIDPNPWIPTPSIGTPSIRTRSIGIAGVARDVVQTMRVGTVHPHVDLQVKPPRLAASKIPPIRQGVHFAAGLV